MESFNSNLFVIKYHSFSARFTAEFLYVTSWTELSFSSKHFTISNQLRNTAVSDS